MQAGERVALQGGNGSGKSSILKLICGLRLSEEVTIPYSGQVHIGSGLVISYVPQDASFLSGSLTDYAKKQNIDESLLKAILRKLDFTREQFDLLMEDFSGGQKKKVLLASSLCQRAHLYIWDNQITLFIKCNLCYSE